MGHVAGWKLWIPCFQMPQFIPQSHDLSTVLPVEVDAGKPWARQQRPGGRVIRYCMYRTCPASCGDLPPVLLPPATNLQHEAEKRSVADGSPLSLP